MRGCFKKEQLQICKILDSGYILFIYLFIINIFIIIFIIYLRECLENVSIRNRKP